MKLSDRLKGLSGKAKEAAAEHKDQIQDAVKKAEVAADRKTGGQYHDQIVNAGEKVESYVEGLNPSAAPQDAKGPGTGTEPGEPAAEPKAPDSPRSQ
jgi:hypothetical protein